VEVEKRKMDVHHNQFWCARLGATCRLKEKLNFSKTRGEREFRACWRHGRYYRPCYRAINTPQVLNSPRCWHLTSRLSWNLEGSADRFCSAPAFWAGCTPEIFRTPGQCDQRFSQHSTAQHCLPSQTSLQNA